MIYKPTSSLLKLAATLAILLPYLAIAFLFIADLPPQGDEHLHQDQILRFIRKDFTMNPAVTLIPGYHATVALISAITGRSSLFSLRLYTLVISIVSIAVFHLLVTRIDPKAPLAKTLQYGFLPVLTPFFMLVYTDVLSLLFVCLAVLMAIRKWSALAAAAAIAAVLVRQTDIVWLILPALLLAWESGYVKHPDIIRTRLNGWWDYQFRIYIRKEAISKGLRDFWPYVAAIIGFLAFAAVNGSIALGDKGSHPFPAFYLGNVYFMLLVIFALLLPLHIANLPRMWKAVSRHPIVIPLLIIVFFLFYLATFNNDHPNNQLPFFLRNRVLMLMTSSLAWKAAFFPAIGISAFSLAVTPLLNYSYYLIYPITFAVITPSWLIEQRYFLVSLVLFMAFRVTRHWIVEYAHVTWYAVATTFLLMGIYSNQFFL